MTDLIAELSPPGVPALVCGSRDISPAHAPTTPHGLSPSYTALAASAIRRRKAAPERRARLKDIDLTNIRRRWVEEFEPLGVPHPNALTLDTSRGGPRRAALRILEHVRSATGDGAPQL